VLYTASASINWHLVTFHFTRELIMSTKDNLENLARNTWLAGLGSIDSSKDVLIKSIDAAQEKSNSLYDELQMRGEAIQNKINDKKDEIQSKINNKKDVIQAKSKKLLGICSEVSDEEKLDQLNSTVDQLTTTIAKLIEKRNAEAEAAKQAEHKAAKQAEPKAAKQAEHKAAKQAQPKTNTKK
jgi:outer membrane murein-binding lipoprotein Lpp